MAGALIRRKVGAGGVSANEEDRETAPSYLLDFPGPSSRIKDLHLAVLLGRRVKLNSESLNIMRNRLLEALRQSRMI